MSMQRHCAILQVNSKAEFYLELCEAEHDWDAHNATIFGPFSSESEAEEYLDHFSNPGGYDIDIIDRKPEHITKIRK